MKLFLFSLGQLHNRAPIPGYLVQTDDGINVVIDTGYPRNTIGAYRTDPNTIVHMDEEDYIGNQLSRLGLQPQNINYLISSHFDIDHAGNHDAFVHTPMVVQRHHYETARQGVYPRLTDVLRQFDRPAIQYHFVDGDSELLPGITLIETSGHVPGHQSILIHLPQTGPVLLTIDAITQSTDRDPETRSISPFDLDETGVRASTRKLAAIVEREHVQLTVYGHDQQQWAQLQHAPAYYE